MMKINVYSEKSGNFGANSEKKPMIIIESRKRPLEPGQKDKNGKPILSLKEKYPDAMIIDVTSKAQDEFVKFSPFYPIGGHLARSEGLRGIRHRHLSLFEARYEEHETNQT